MKKIFEIVLVLIFLIPIVVYSQQVADFENLTVPAEGYFNGSTEHSGTIGQAERFDYENNAALFRVFYTPEDGYDYWSGTAYSKQTDLTTADWTNYSAYANAPDGGGYDDSANYAFGYMFNADTISFNCPICNSTEIIGAYFTNSVWAYHYMNGSDGTGAGTYEDGDYYKLIFKGMNELFEYNGLQTEFYLADFTNGNSFIREDWTWVDLSILSQSFSIEISYITSDDYTPAYYCLDNLTFDYVSEISENNTININIFPNPTTDFINIQNSALQGSNYKITLTDISGKILFEKNNCSGNETINLIEFNSGFYFLNIISNNYSFTKKIIKK